MPTYAYAILGGGMVAGYAAKELAKRGLEPGELGIISSDSAPPYERPPLSKEFLAGTQAEASLFISDADFYRDHGIDLRLSTVVDRVDVRNKRLHARTGERFCRQIEKHAMPLQKTIDFRRGRYRYPSGTRRMKMKSSIRIGIGSDSIFDPTKKKKSRIISRMLTA